MLVLMGHSAGAFNVMSALYHPTPLSATSVRGTFVPLLAWLGLIILIIKVIQFVQMPLIKMFRIRQVMPYYFVENNQVKHYLFTATKMTISLDEQ